MRTIYKYPFEITDVFTIKMPGHSKILDVKMQNGTPCIWALVDTEEPEIEKTFYLYGTGHKFTKGEYVGTFQVNGGELVFHLFK